MRDFRWVSGQVAEVQRFINVPRRWCEQYPARERRELWITADQGPEFKFVVHTTLMPARRGHARRWSRCWPRWAASRRSHWPAASCRWGWSWPR